MSTADTSGSDDRLWSVLCHASLFLGVPFLLPLIVYLVKKDDSRLTAWHAREALNFHISLLIYSLLALPLCMICIGFFILLAISLGSVVLGIVACIKASEGAYYRYPLNIRLIN